MNTYPKYQPLPSGTVVVMGRGDFAISAVVCPATGVEGITYLPLPEPREFDADCSDLFTEGTLAENPAAVIYFEDSRSVAKSIAMLMQLHARMRMREHEGQQT